MRAKNENMPLRDSAHTGIQTHAHYGLGHESVSQKSFNTHVEGNPQPESAPTVFTFEQNLNWFAKKQKHICYICTHIYAGFGGHFWPLETMNNLQSIWWLRFIWIEIRLHSTISGIGNRALVSVCHSNSTSFDPFKRHRIYKSLHVLNTVLSHGQVFLSARTRNDWWLDRRGKKLGFPIN